MSETCDIFEFDSFHLDPARRSLIGRAGPIVLSARAFDILVLLVEHRGRVVTKDEIMSHVWRGTIVEENNLAVQISALRRALSDRASAVPLIVTIPGQGYRFVGQLTPPAEAIAAQPATPERPALVLPPPFVPPTPPPAPGFARRVWWLVPAFLAFAATSALLVRFSPHRAPYGATAVAPVPPRLSIAVLPFRNLGDDQRDNYLADAVSDDLTTDLAHLPGSVVIARESSDSFRGSTKLISDIGRALNVRYLLEGSLRREEDGFSINAQLIEAATNAHVWAQRFRVSRAKLGDAQENIVRNLASALGVTLVDAEVRRFLQAHTGAPDALDLFLQAQSILDRSDAPASFVSAQALLERAVVLDPNDVDALSALGWLLLRKMHNGADAQRAQDLAEARVRVDAALALARNNPVALAAEGIIQEADGRLEAAQGTFQRALSFDTNNVDARRGLSHCLLKLGHFDEAASLLQELLLIDPASPISGTRYSTLGYAYLMLGRLPEALTWLERAAANDPDPPVARNDLDRVEWDWLMRIGAIGLAGDPARAQALYAEYAKVWPHRTVWELGIQFTRAASAVPGVGRFLGALQAAGMPAFADEHADQSVPVTDLMGVHSMFDPTPRRAPGAETIDTARLTKLISTDHPPILDVGSGAASVPGADLRSADQLSSEQLQEYARTVTASGTPPVRSLVVMSDSSNGWASYNAVLQLRSAGLRIFWYRGGEEAWAAAGMKAQDRRSP
jgi:TolB-like protein/DNA-binding winged helix-turn-helix (wHTH) protein/Flp pilus assembly protein TadD/rhodanese-related sulfurtransferase